MKSISSTEFPIDAAAIYTTKTEHYSIDNPAPDRRCNLYAGEAISSFVTSALSFAPWIHTLYVIAMDELPDSFAVSSEKVKVIHPDDFMPEEYRGSYNINAVELNLHRIEGICDRFVYFSPGSFLCSNVKPTFFFENGLPADYASEDMSAIPDMHDRHIHINSVLLLNTKYDRKVWQSQNRSKVLSPKCFMGLVRNIYFYRLRRVKFMGFEELNYPTACLKKSFEAVWEEFGDELIATCRRKEASEKDINHILIRYYQYVRGWYVPTDWKKTLHHIDHFSEAASGNHSRPIVIVNTPAKP